MRARLAGNARSPLAAAAPALAAAALLAACGGVSERPAQGPSPRPAAAVPDVPAFERDPDASSWETLHAVLLQGPIDAATESRIVAVLANREMPRNVFDAAAVDLATLDWGGTMQWVQKFNVAARTDGSPQGARAVRNSSELAWLMLALRAAGADDSVDLTRADLRAGVPPPALPLNLRNVDFSGSELSAMWWRDTNLTGAAFGGTVVAGALRCTNCTFGTLQYGGTVVLANGKWQPR